MAVGPDLSRFSVSQLHELTGRERRWIKQRLSDRGVTPCGQDGRTVYYPSREALTAIYLAGGEKLDPMQERAALDRVRREVAELELAKARGEVLAVEDVVATWSEMLAAMKAQLRAIPKTMVTRVPGFTRKMATQALRMIDEALNELSGEGVPKKSAGKRRRSRAA